MKTQCKNCKKEINLTPSKIKSNNFCSKKCYSEDLKIIQKGKHLSPDTEFNKGHIPFYAGKKVPERVSLGLSIGKKGLLLKKEKIIKSYNLIKSTRKVAKLFNCSKSSISKILKDNGLIIKYNFHPKKIKVQEEIRKCKCGCGGDVCGYNQKLKMPVRYLPGHNDMELDKRNKLRDYTKKNNANKTYEEIYGIEKAKRVKEKLSVPLEEKVGIVKAKQLKEKARNFMAFNNPMKILEIRKKASAKLQGIPLEKWERFVSFEPYSPEFNKEFKNLIRLRDNFCCLNCGISEPKHIIFTGKKLTVHHIDYDKKNTCLQNCCTLCRKCNFLVNKNRHEWTDYYQEKLSKLYNYEYENDFRLEQEVKNENN